MSKRYPWAKWTLPEVVDPEIRRCFIVPVPDDPMHLAAFRGALLALGSAYKWQDDTAHTARDVANVWREIYDLVEERTCEVPLIDVRQNDELPCVLEKTSDGTTWTSFANLQLCPPKLRMGATGGVEWFDGTEWVPLPDGGDERQDGGYDPPWPTPPTGETGNCLAAENIVAIFDTSMLQGKVALDAGMIGLGIIAGIGTILSPFIPAAIFTTAAAAIGGMIFNGGVTFLTDVTSTENLDALKCAIVCTISSDGSVTASQFNDLKDNLASRISDATIRSLYELWLDGLGPVGLSRMGAAADITTGDCGDCGCAFNVLYDFTVSGYTDIWASEPLDGTGWGATYVTGTGWEFSSVSFAMSAIMPAGMHLTEVEVGNGQDSVNFWLTTTTDWSSTQLITPTLVNAEDATFAEDVTTTNDCKFILSRTTPYQPIVYKIRLKGDGSRPPGGVDV